MAETNFDAVAGALNSKVFVIGNYNNETAVYDSSTASNVYYEVTESGFYRFTCLVTNSTGIAAATYGNITILYVENPNTRQDIIYYVKAGIKIYCGKSGSGRVLIKKLYKS